MSSLSLYSVEVPESWTDHYGHMNEGYYVVAFSDASWALQAHLGVGTDYYDETGFAMVTVESHIRYLDSVHRGDLLTFESMILGFDAKRAIFGHVLKDGDRVCATFEAMTLHLNHKAGGLGEMAEETLARMQAAMPDPVPDWAGRRIAMKKK